MILPYNTDAPIYHFPFATIGLVVLNTVIYFFTAQADVEQVGPWVLIFGDGLHPVQWLSCNFLHADFMHLFGNMFYLWGFGLVVEGKLGWWRMLLLYLVIGVVFAAIIQIAMLGADEGGALGASGVIFGLLAIALVWAPRNEISCFVWLVHPTTVDLSIVFFATSFLAWQIFVAWLSGFGLSSEVAHLVGAGVGAIAGVALLKLDLVDCEGWDVFAVWRGTEGQKVEPKPRLRTEPLLQQPEAAIAPPPQSLRSPALQIKNRLLAEDPEGALQAYSAARAAQPQWRLAGADLLALISGLHHRKLWSASIPPMVDYLRQCPDTSIRVRLKLAQILLASENRPGKALEVLAKVPASAVPPELQATHQKLIDRAQAATADGELEIADGEEW